MVRSLDADLVGDPGVAVGGVAGGAVVDGVVRVHQVPGDPGVS